MSFADREVTEVQGRAKYFVPLSFFSFWGTSGIKRGGGGRGGGTARHYNNSFFIVFPTMARSAPNSTYTHPMRCTLW